MKIELVTGATLYESCKEVYLSLDYKNLDKDFLIIVPDRFSLQAEKILFNTLKIKATFNLNIITLDSFAQNVLKMKKKQTAILSNLEGVLIVKKIIEENQDSLLLYKKNTTNFCNEIYKTITQIKSSNIKPYQLVYRGKSSSLTKKIHDLQFIYEKYEESHSDKMDALDILENAYDNEEYTKNKTIAFVGFDSFTEIGFKILETCILNAEKVIVGVVQPINKLNAYIYEQDILEKIKRISEKSNIDVQVISSRNKLDNKKDLLLNNLFATEIQSRKEDYISVFAANSINEEINYLCNVIKDKIYNGVRYKNIAISCNLDMYKSSLERILTARNIPFYTDSNVVLKDSFLTKFIIKIFDLKKKNIKNEDLLYIIDSDLIEINDKVNLIAFINEREINGKLNFCQHLKDKLGYINFLLSELDSGNFINVINDILEKTNNGFELYIKKLESNNLIKEALIESQVKDKIHEIVSILDKFKFKNFNDFYEAFDLAVSTYELSSLPAFCDAVYIGDVTKSFFDDVDFLFLLGANRGKLPVCVKDCGLISDEDCFKLGIENKIEPTIKMINRRNRFKLFNNISVAKEQLFISYLTKDVTGKKLEKSLFVNQLQNIYEEKEENNLYLMSTIDNNSDIKKFLFLLGGDKKTATEKMIESSFKRNIENVYIDSLQDYINFDYKKLILNKDFLYSDSLKEIFFRDNKFSVSQIERFYDCPFKHMVDYGFKIKEKFTNDLEKKEFGLLFHSLFENFVKYFSKKLKEVTDDDINEFLNQYIPSVLDNEKIVFSYEKEIICKNIYNIAQKICKRIVKEAKNSEFIPYLQEYAVREIFKIDDEEFTLVGKIDRIDKCGDKIRIIDYKTGNVTKDIYKDLYYGKKLQLFIYSKILKDNIKLNPVGFYYFNAKQEYNEAKKILEGLTLNDGSILLIDNRLNIKGFKSDIIDANVTTKGIKYKDISEVDESKLFDYALEVSKKAIRHILSGRITPCPDKESCEYCKYRGICLYNQDSGYRMQTKIEKIDILGGENG